MAATDPQLAQPDKAEKLDVQLAVEIARTVRAEMQKFEKRISDQVGAAINANAQTVKRMDSLETSFNALKADLEKTRVERADREVKEAQARLSIALEHKDGLTTEERLQVQKLMEERTINLERDRSEKRRTWWRDKVLPGVTTALIISIVAPAGLALFIGLLAFFLRALGIEVQIP